MSACCCMEHPHCYYDRHRDDEHWRECSHCSDQREASRRCSDPDCTGCDLRAEGAS